MDTNVRATIMCTRHAISSMKKHHFDGHVVNINSIAGHYIPFANFNVYSSSKYTITAFTQSLLTELANLKSGIRITSISPGLVDTAMAGGVQNMPMLKPADVADAVLYAISAPPTVNISELTIQPASEKRL
ncbi:hypothetical protein evm_005059 [Chilo suppressalis]|nr:hypothetical protein evm_005059 [Chilo suppressalis]